MFHVCVCVFHCVPSSPTVRQPSSLADFFSTTVGYTVSGSPKQKIVFSFSFQHVCCGGRVACECYIGYLFIINSIYYYLLFAFFRFILERVVISSTASSSSPMSSPLLLFTVSLSALLFCCMPASVCVSECALESTDTHRKQATK